MIVDMEKDYERDFVWSDSILIVPEVGPCLVCKTDTFFAEVNFEAHICSYECENAIWNEYFQAQWKWIRGEGNKPKVRRSNGAPTVR